MGRTPGIWDVETNKFAKVPGMSDANMLETANTVLLPPAQDEKYMVIGGGGVGQSELSSEKTRIADLKADDPKFVDGSVDGEGHALSAGLVLPDDSVLVSGGRRTTAAAATPTSSRRGCTTRTPTRSSGSPIRWWDATTTPVRSCCPTGA
ncbi:hypothetical protein STENM327S_07966 [Streptomyces tendae]